MFSSKKIRIDQSLYDRLAAAAQRGGYASTEELIVNALERAAAASQDDLDQKRVEEQLRGLGYLE